MNLWLQRLPTNTQAILLASIENLPQHPVLADKVHEITIDTHNSAQVHSVANTDKISNAQAMESNNHYEYITN